MPLAGVDDVKKMLAKNKKESNDKIRKVYFSGLRDVVKGTPVDTGRIRNNWFLTKGLPFTLSSGRESQKGGNGSFRSLEGMPKNVLNVKVYFSNNMPYVGVLEYGGYPSPVRLGTYNKKSKSYTIKSVNGYSKQAPKGWVRSALISMQNKMRAL